MKKKHDMGIVVPTFIEPNGKMKRFLEIAKNSKVRHEYAQLTKKLNADPVNVSRKIKENLWQKKTLDEVLEAVG